MGKQIFISYKAEERKKAESLKNEIEKAGFSCWMAPLSIPGGSSYAAEIENAIRNCNALVLLFSEAAMNSKWVEKEIDRAINQNKLILPLRTEEFDLSSSYSYYLTNVQFYDAFEDYDSALIRLIERIKVEYEPDLPVLKDEPKPEEAKVVTPTPVPPVTVEDVKPVSLETSKHNRAQKSPKAKKEKDKPVKEKKKLPFKKIIISSAALILLVLIAVIIAIFAGERNIKIAGEDISINTASLSIKDCELTAKDIENINKLKKLDRIKLSNCGLNNEEAAAVNVFGAGNKIKLIEINLSGNKEITDLSFIENVEKIDCLDVSGTGITDFTTIPASFASDSYASAVYGDCIVIKADNCMLTSFDGLDKVKPHDGLLFGFSFNNCGLNNKTLEKFGEVMQNNLKPKSVSVNENPDITELAFLENCETLTELDASGTGIANFYGLEKCIYLEVLRARNCGITKLNGLENSTVLKAVDLNGNDISDIRILAQSAETMEYLFLADNSLNRVAHLALTSSIGNSSGSTAKTYKWDADVIKEFNNIKALDLSNSSFKDTSFLEGKSNIRWLCLRGCSVQNFDCFDTLKDIEYLDISNNYITSFDFDSLPASLSYLNISNNWASSTKRVDYGKLSLKEYINLNYFDVHGSGYNIIAFTGKCDSIVLGYVEGTDYSTLSSVNKIYMINCPLDKQVGLKKSFADKIDFVSIDDYDNFVTDKIKEEGYRLLEDYLGNNVIW